MKYKKIMFMLVLTIFIFGAASVCASDVNDTVIASEDDSTVELSQADTEGMISSEEDELIGQTENEIISEGKSGTFAELQANINAATNGSTLTLNKNYECKDGFDAEGILINKSITIDGNGSKIDAQGKSRIFKITAENVILKNIIFTNGKTTVHGGAVYFGMSGVVANCNFVDNTAEQGGAVWLISGTVTNCNFSNSHAFAGAVFFNYYGEVTNCSFIGNTASNGGAVHFYSAGNVVNCNFTSNTAYYSGAVHLQGTGSVTNCNFINNQATGEDGSGGAVRMTSGTVTNCNFVNNSASKGGAILSRDWWAVTADTCIFKTNSDTTFNTHNIPPALNVDNFTTFYGSGVKLTFDLKTNSSIPVTNGNISISVYFKNGTWFDNYSCLSGEGWTVNLPVGSYYAIFDTEYAEFQPINRTITVLPDNTFLSLNNLINNNGLSEINLTKDYHFDSELDSEFKNGIAINKNMIINGQGHTIDAQGQARILDLQQGKTILKNITFKNGSQSFFFGGGAIRCVALVEITNCTFINNGAPSGGAVQLQGWDNVISDCVFMANTADRGGAIELSAAAYNTITGCVFYDNDIFGSQADGCEINNNIFIDSTILFDWTQNYNIDDNWFGNNATNYDMKPVDYNINSWLFLNATADSIIISPSGTSDITFKLYKYGSDEVSEYDNTLLKPVNLNITSSNGHVNVTAVRLGETVQYTADNLGTGQVTATIENIIYTIELNIIKLNPNLSVESQNVTYSENTFIKLNYTSTATGKVNVTLKGKRHDFKFTDLELDTAIVLGSVPVDEYDVNVSYSGDDNFDNATATGTLTITLSYVPHVNVTSLTTTNKTVNITAKSNIPNEIIGGKLLFILPNGTQIEATYGSNGIWWAEHTFDAYGEYKINATYVGLDNVTVNNGTITINKVNSTITLDDIVLDYGETKNVTVTTTGANGITAKIDGNNVTVINNYTIQIPVLDAGTYNLTVTTIPDDDYNPVTKEVNITVNKVNSTLTVSDIVFDYGSSGSTVVSLAGADGVNATVVGQPKAVVKVNGTNITVSDLDAGTYTLTVTAIADKNHNNITKNATITVNKLKTELTGNAITTTYNVNKDLVITLKDSKGKALSGVKVTVDLNGAKTYTTDKNGQVKVSTKGLAPKAYTAKVTFNGDTNYDKSAKDIKVTVKKATPKLTAKKKTYKTTTKTKKYTIVLKDNTGKAIKKAKVTLKVKGKTYKATTNSKGKATFKITKLNKKGTFKATITYKGNKYYNKISKKAKIKVIVTFKTVSKGSKDKATVKEIQQALKDKGYYLTYQGHYLKVDGKFKGCTERSVKEFQKDKGLKVTGKVDEKTAKKLGIL